MVIGDCCCGSVGFIFFLIFRTKATFFCILKFKTEFVLSLSFIMLHLCSPIAGQNVWGGGQLGQAKPKGVRGGTPGNF